MYNIEHPSETTYFIACNPLKDVYHHGTINNDQHMTTGQPLRIKGTVHIDLINMIYSQYTSLEDRFDRNPLIDDEIPDDVVREITWSVGYGLAESEATIAVIEQLLPNLSITAIKHPDREEYALPWSQYIIDSIDDSPSKDAILAKHYESIDEGNSKTSAEMIEDGWV